MTDQKRKAADCRDMLSENGCTLRITGSEKEVLIVALRHAIEEHGHKDTLELRKQIKSLIKDE